MLIQALHHLFVKSQIKLKELLSLVPTTNKAILSLRMETGLWLKAQVMQRHSARIYSCVATMLLKGMQSETLY